MKIFSFHACQSFISVMICLLFFAGCAPPPRGGTPLAAINQALEEPEALPPKVEIPQPPPEIRSALIPSFQPLSAPVQEDEARFDIAASQVPAREFFMSIVEGSPVNMIVHPAVAGEISVDLKHTTIKEVLQVVHNVYGYPYFKTGNIYQVMPIGLQARTFQVNYLNLVRNGESQIRVSSGQVEDVSSTENGDERSRTSTSETVTGSSIKTKSTSDFWTELQHAIQTLVGHEDGRKVVVQPQASIVVVVAMPAELEMVGKYLQTIENNLQRQVVIEAKIIEVTLNDGFQSGINWAAMSTNSDGEGVIAGQVGGGRIFSEGKASFTDGNVLGEELPEALESLGFGGVFGVGVNFVNFKGLILLLEKQGDVQVLSSPR
ncbi:MAG: secretin N-terminal domain-containing protein, partial [Desulfuromusa sp.]|nr:secretin N-terminal domain-containing protein [Desulfuromusa sp.]